MFEFSSPLVQKSDLMRFRRFLFYPARPKGLRAESARAVTGRRCPRSGEEEDFLTRQPDFFTKTAVTRERHVGKSLPRWEIKGLS